MSEPETSDTTVGIYQPERQMSIDTSRCPLCGEPNTCAMADSAGAERECWCVSATIPESALERIPAEQRGAACICAACARQAEATSRPTSALSVDDA